MTDGLILKGSNVWGRDVDSWGDWPSTQLRGYIQIVDFETFLLRNIRTDLPLESSISAPSIHSYTLDMHVEDVGYSDWHCRRRRRTMSEKY
jgi:hypothetical protein